MDPVVHRSTSCLQRRMTTAWAQVSASVAPSKERAYRFTGYWKDAKDYTKDSQVTENGTQRSKGKRRALAIDSDEDTQSQTLETIKKPVRKQARTKETKKLFLDSDDDGKDGAGFGSSEEQLLAPSMPVARARASKRRHVIADDDSDDGVTFKGFSKKRRTK